jgi:hypothetical protein
MESETTPKPIKLIQIKRNQCTITQSPTLNVYSASEQVTWNGGGVQISGIGASRQDALIALDSNFDLLKKILGEVQS